MRLCLPWTITLQLTNGSRCHLLLSTHLRRGCCKKHPIRFPLPKSHVVVLSFVLGLKRPRVWPPNLELKSVTHISVVVAKISPQLGASSVQGAHNFPSCTQHSGEEMS
jgi:hypothetical protein